MVNASFSLDEIINSFNQENLEERSTPSVSNSVSPMDNVATQGSQQR